MTGYTLPRSGSAQERAWRNGWTVRSSRALNGRGTYLSFALEGRTVYEAYGYAVDKGSGNLDVLQIHASADTKAAPNIAEKLTQMLGTISHTNQ